MTLLRYSLSSPFKENSFLIGVLLLTHYFEEIINGIKFMNMQNNRK